ncbi:MAG TPA: LLM class flavin-dependent oxidoreductase [Propionibacteriaceae bacterium]
MAYVTPTLGFAFVPTLPPEALRSVATSVEASGLDELWVWEDCFKESGIASATAALAWTSTLRVGIGLMPTPLRNVALTAMEIAMIERMFPGRLIAGVGHGVQVWMGQVGGRVDSPMTLLREYADALRRLLDGERVSVEGRYVQLDDVALDWPPSPPPPLMLGGSGPKSLALAAELGDGNLLACALTDDELRDAVAVITTHADRPDHPVVVSQITATGPGAQRRIDEEAPRWGKTAGLGIGVGGDAAEIADCVRRLVGLGATTVVFQPCEDDPDLPGFVEFLGREVKPLVAG